MIASLAPLANSDTWGPTLLGAPNLEEDGAARLCLVVIGDGTVATFPLPESGRITIGRSGHNDVRVDDPLVSREHAVFHVGPELRVEDLGSANGTRLSAEQLAPNSIVTIVRGQVVEVGSTMLVVQLSTNASRPRRLWTHSYFEMRLEEECQRRQSRPADEEGNKPNEFSVIRLHVEGDASESALQETLTAALRAGDVVACYATGEYELILVDTSSTRAQTVVDMLVNALEEHDLAAQAGVATYPRDGRTPDQLVSHACAELRGRASFEPPPDEIVVEDPAMRDLYRVAERISQGTISVMLLGETGVGKEVFSETVHRLSPRRGKPFVRINCAALSESLLESELFGYEKGAFTGADKAKPGLLETAQGGTVFLDELGEMPLNLQAKLLRVIEQSQVLRVGGLTPRNIDVRYVSATNRDIEEDVAQGNFRQDLFYRLNGVTLVIPPLRERRSEIDGLADTFLARVCQEMGDIPEPDISSRAMELLKNYRWPGNIRELKNIIERAALLCTGSRIDPEHLPVEKMTATWQPAPSKGTAPAHPASGGYLIDATPPPPGLSTDDLEERQAILQALERCGGNQTRAARELGISRRTLSSRLNKYKVPRPRKATS